MTREKIDLLQEELVGLQLAAGYLGYSMERCLNLTGQEEMQPEQLERLESLTSRFARLADLLIQRIFRLIDEIELTGGGTILDRIYRAEKRDWADASEMIKIRELRNLIAHEYSNEKMSEIYTAVAILSPALLAVVPKVIAYADNIPR
ncbi:HepT-like ribonuclease domain-containing protein [Methyloglobulus sp.]|uniref:HepT-like ribonuclease domain-containing protein n=1 Tax=Methyloglobulus sp. TaxID=2518622 RepID=UPI003989C6EF